MKDINTKHPVLTAAEGVTDVAEAPGVGNPTAVASALAVAVASAIINSELAGAAGESTLPSLPADGAGLPPRPIRAGSRGPMSAAYIAQLSAWEATVHGARSIHRLDLLRNRSQQNHRHRAR